MVIAVAFGIPLGVVAALHRNRAADHALRIVTVAGLAVASFWLALMLQLFFSMELRWLPLQARITGFPPPPITGFYVVDALVEGNFKRLGNVLAHLTLPAFTLAFPALATVVRFTRAGVLETLQRPFVGYQRAMGVPAGLIVWKYVLRNSLVSTVTQIGLLFGILLAGAVVIETVFQWPGIGAYAFEAILHSDYAAVMGFTVYAGVRVRHRQPDRRHLPRPPRSARGRRMRAARDIVAQVAARPLRGDRPAHYPAARRSRRSWPRCSPRTPRRCGT